ncbi:MerR family transcriptional regulator [uncultured Oscillibacter sp.]|uniref:MerR family transcriptional regulator n=1 Tax=uncultured Oscillibacter sp. TaxID=876091 RepID=UPI00261C19CB|nr:MerR family transcriptional regulator [uncultured Oscillibacter sp.]
MLKIGEFSRLSRVSIRSLRRYDEAGLLAPASIDPFTGYRYYSERQLPVANRIRALRDMGFPLAAVREVLGCYDDPKALERCLLLQRAGAKEVMEEAERRLRLLDTALERLRKDETMMQYDVTIKTIPERQVASVRQIISSYDREGDLWSVYCQETARMNIQDGDPVLCVAVYHDGEHKEQDVDVEIQRSVAGSYPDTEHVKFKTVPAVQVASATFRGSYDQFYAVNEAVAAWVADNGWTLAGAAFFIYHVSPHDTRNPDEFVTEVCYPVKRK